MFEHFSNFALRTIGLYVVKQVILISVQKHHGSLVRRSLDAQRVPYYFRKSLLTYNINKLCFKKRLTDENNTLK